MLVRLSGTEQMQLVASGTVTILQLALAHLARIEFRDKDVLAFVYLDKELILREARKLDALAVQSRGPLHGLLVAVKDIISTAGMMSIPERIDTTLLIPAYD